MTIQETLAHATQQLQTISTTPVLDAQVLLANTLNRDRTYLYTWPEHILTPTQTQCFNHRVKRRKQGEPIAYILNKKEFWSLELRVTADTLTPRPETELLVEIMLQHTTAPLRILDLGTGSGAIALALATERPNWHIDACERCDKALQVAQQNAQNLALSNIHFIRSDWFSALAKQRYHIIVSNPPYIAASDACWQDTSLHYEPHTALLATDNGYYDLTTIIRQAPNYLHPNGQLVLEHGATQQKTVMRSLAEHGFTDIRGLQDYAHLPRAVVARYKTS